MPIIDPAIALSAQETGHGLTKPRGRWPSPNPLLEGEGYRLVRPARP